jgi:DNA mismatch repair protein MutL
LSAEDGARPVRVLPDALANQIAAGEVIERPASVVKELVENALDADATRVVVTLDKAGQRRIQVLDDGHGMDRGDATRSLVRHATSKIATTEDLSAIGTLGFRGEALPSIASVSQFRLVTRRADADVATEITVMGGGAVAIKDSAAPIGTCVTVEELFYNVPARRKFLKADSTEVGHVKTLMNAFSLAYPYVHFRLVIDGRKSLDHPSVKRLEQRVHQVLGKTTFGRLHPVSGSGPIQVRGYIAEPHFSRTNQSAIHTFVNGRRVRDRTVTHGLISAYGTLIDRGRFPWAVLYVTLPPEDVDVNVHPAKAEVRFVHPQDVHAAIARACRVTLGNTPWRRSGNEGGIPQGQGRLEPGPLFRDARRSPQVGERRAPLGRAYRPAQPPEAPRPPQVLDFRADPARRVPTGLQPQTPRPAAAQAIDDSTIGPLSYVGLAGRDYILATSGRAVLTVDRHRAVALLASHQLTEAVASGAPIGQPLLFPTQGEPTAALSEGLARHRETLAQLGLVVEPFGGGTWQVTEVPAPLAGAPVWDMVRVAVHALTQATGRSQADVLHNAIGALADLAPTLGDLTEDRAKGLVAAIAALSPDVASRAVHATPFTALDRFFGRQRDD